MNIMGVDVNAVLAIGILIFLFAAVGAMALMGRATQSISGAFIGLAVVCFGTALLVYFAIRKPTDDFTPTLVSVGLGGGGVAAMWFAFQLSLHKATSTYEQSVRRPDGTQAIMKVQHVVQGRGAHDSHTRFMPEVHVLDTGGQPPKQLPSNAKPDKIVQEFEPIDISDEELRAYMEGRNRQPQGGGGGNQQGGRRNKNRRG